MVGEVNAWKGMLEGQRKQLDDMNTVIRRFNARFRTENGGGSGGGPIRITCSVGLQVRGNESRRSSTPMRLNITGTGSTAAPMELYMTGIGSNAMPTDSHVPEYGSIAAPTEPHVLGTGSTAMSKELNIPNYCENKNNPGSSTNKFLHTNTVTSVSATGSSIKQHTDSAAAAYSNSNSKKRHNTDQLS